MQKKIIHLQIRKHIEQFPKLLSSGKKRAKKRRKFGISWLMYCQGANPILLKRAKRNFIFHHLLFSPDTLHFIKYILLSRSNPLFMPLSGH